MLYNQGMPGTKSKTKTKTYSASEAREHWAEVLEAVEQGQQVMITKYGEPVAAISHPPGGQKPGAAVPPPGYLAAEGWTIEIAEDFDAIPEGFEDYV
jgi:antitoxin (DNA-binding transcriptional repressor) of toxin-antitoxin stability system